MSRVKKTAVTVVKVAISVGILATLILLPSNQQAFREVWEKPKNWGMFAVAGGCCLAAVCITILRWYWLVRALGLPFRLRDAFRLGFFGYLCNFISLGAVGGDVFKAVFLAREQPGKRTEAVATVVIDRILGLFALMLVVSVAAWWADLLAMGQRRLDIICYSAWTATGVLMVGVLLIYWPGFVSGPWFEMLTGLPRVGPVFGKLIATVRLYRRRWDVMLGTLAMSVATHLVFVLCIWAVARGLPGPRAEYQSQLVIVPFGLLASTVPLPGGGLGTFEAAMEFLFRTVPNTPPFEPGQGTLVAFGYRAITLVIALIGFFYWVSSRKEFQRLREQAEAEAKDSTTNTAQSPHYLGVSLSPPA